GLLALAGILGVGEGHLFHHRKARRLVSGDFAKLGSLFQSFLKRASLKTEAALEWRRITLGRMVMVYPTAKRGFSLHHWRLT
ncbi:hypothetical protein NLO86_27125, partial [Pseudomonas savastanoi]|uniref:hypothetical protein n=1 Tax=Pseudomonas savastanoi TaxID=29438 RepID=UPI0021099A23